MSINLKDIFERYDADTQDQIDACAAAEGKDRYAYMAELLKDALDELRRKQHGTNETRH